MKYLSLLLLTLSFQAYSQYEIKLPVSYSEYHQLLHTVSIEKIKQRDVYFFDTIERDFYGKSLIFRLRMQDRGKKEEVETTIKWRGLSYAEMAQWERRLSQLGYGKKHSHKCEIDLVLYSKRTASCSIMYDIEVKSFDEDKLKEYFSKTQLSLLTAAEKSLFFNNKAEVIGPITSESFDTHHTRYGSVDFEAWTFKGNKLYEVSQKGSTEEKLSADFARFVESVLGELNSQVVRTTKTRWALFQ